MTRPLRIEYPGALYHVTSRGDRREDIFFSEDDRLLWLKLFGLVCLRHNWVCHAWCQMNNHYHVVVETMEGNLARGMRQLNGVYTQTFNRNHQRVGHVFQGRYRSIIVEKDAYLLELIRYVLLNPVRVDMVNNAADWPWSSYGAVVGATGRPEWLQTDSILAHFGRSRRKAISGFVDFVRAGIEQPGLWQSLRGQVYLGSKAFIEQVQQRGDDQSAVFEIPRIQRRPLAPPLSEFRETIADTWEAMAAAYATGDYTMQEIATCFGVHYSTASRAVSRAEQKHA